MGDGFVRSFDDVYLIYPLKKYWDGDSQGNWIPIRRLDPCMQFHCADPEFPHMACKYFMTVHHKYRLALFQRNEMNYYKQEIRWVIADVSEQYRKVIL